MLRIAINFVITTALLLIFNAFGWLTLRSAGMDVDSGHLTASILKSVLLVAVVLWLVSILVEIVYAFSVLVTLGLMLLAYPFIGWATLAATAHFMPGSLVLHGFWISVLCGFLLMALQLRTSKPSTD